MLPTKNVILFLFAAFASSLTIAQDSPPAAAPNAPSESQQQANILLLTMATELGNAAKFKVDIDSGYDALQASGQKIEFGETRNLSVERPSLMQSDIQLSDGSEEQIVFDGEWITVSHEDANVYARAPQPGDIDASVKFYVRELGMRLPLAIMLSSHFADELAQRTLNIDYVEQTKLQGVTAHHLAGRTKAVDYQVWISADKHPVPLRVVLTYREAPGQPQYWANFSNWNFRPSFLQKTFRFNPLPNAREVPLVANFTRVGANPGNAATQSGEKP